MSATLKMLLQETIPSTLATGYTSGAPTVTLIKEILLTNTSTTVPATVQIYAVQSAGTAGPANILLNQTIAVGETIGYGLATTIPTGSTLQLVSSVAGVVGCTISGVEL